VLASGVQSHGTRHAGTLELLHPVDTAAQANASSSVACCHVLVIQPGTSIVLDSGDTGMLGGKYGIRAYGVSTFGWEGLPGVPDFLTKLDWSGWCCHLPDRSNEHSTPSVSPHGVREVLLCSRHSNGLPPDNPPAGSLAECLQAGEATVCCSSASGSKHFSNVHVAV